VADLSPLVRDAGAGWLIFRDSELLVRLEGERAGLLRLEAGEPLPLPVGEGQEVGVQDGVAWFSAETPPHTLPPVGTTFVSLRRLYGLLDAAAFALVVRARQMLTWATTHRFCGRCGTPTETVADETAKSCPACGLVRWPRLDPAVIVAVRRGDRLLLARNRRHPNGFYSVLAGFVEPGETLEQAVVREVQEETGITVGNLRYFGSQSWPWPHSLMVGFSADYMAGEIVVQDTELVSADWFSADALPPFPPPPSIAHALITAFRNPGIT
jgi:NAD+ diphosphatase